MNFWLLKSEPETWSWDQQVAAKTTAWDGVRNYQAARYLKEMKSDDRAFFYHSGKERCIRGVVKIIREAYPDPTDSTHKFICVDVETVAPLKTPISLTHIKQDSRLQHLVLVRQSRLSVMPIDPSAWEILLGEG